MKKRLASACIALLAVSTFPLQALAGDSGISSQIDSAKAQRDALVEEQHQLEAQLNDLTAQSQTLGTAVKTLDATKNKLESDIKLTQNKISDADKSIQSLESSMSAAESHIGDHKQAIATALQAVSQYDIKPFWMSLLSDASFADAWTDKSELSGLSGKLDTEVLVLKDAQTELSKEKAAQEKAKQSVIALSGELQGQKSVVEESQKAKQTILAQTQSKEASYQELLKQNLELQKEYDQDIFKMESQLNLHVDTGLLPPKQHGVIGWPFDSDHLDFCAEAKNVSSLGNSHCVTQPFTYNAENGTGHNGDDLRAAVGTPVYSVSSGVVEGTGNSDDQRGCYSYGRWILIKHDNGLSSIYGHLSASLVKTGQRLSTGDLIGYSGGAFRAYGSGNSQAPHLHIGLFASQGVEIKPFTSARYLSTGQGCHNVPLPVADPKAYLDPLAYMPAR